MSFTGFNNVLENFGDTHMFRKKSRNVREDGCRFENDEVISRHVTSSDTVADLWGSTLGLSRYP